MTTDAMIADTMKLIKPQIIMKDIDVAVVFNCFSSGLNRMQWVVSQTPQ